ncbi:Haloalkane dehalogenase [Pseudonocardia sp. Ae717_Ps2]|uniref:haloalkane dehalogenase n=1 Tax=unclassified Pseudonocardia TaxID=2619320 RepID=UPI00094AC529|nr:MULTISPECIES: haloalkane dehalogenase [unclassified Pseudonocardia]OLM14067.1 Haloalkane dehalogenase [Pseudonocardia sp. Ae505_Ps2]OLM31247.1 Haloalkane dehalogenase [Pseudonocardia sp. Ae717_Ps2]
MSHPANVDPHPEFGETATAHDTPVLDSHLHHVESGSGDPVVFIHGNPTSSFLWRHVFRRLEGHGRLLAVDLLGFGDSGKPALEYSLTDQQHHLDAWFDALDLRNVTLVLQDYGAAHGLHWAARHPDRVAAVLLAEPVLRPIESSHLPDQFLDVRALIRTRGAGEEFVLERNAFLTELFPGFFLNPLSAETIAEYQRPFPTPESRRPVLQGPRNLPVDGDPASTVEFLDSFVDWLRTSDVPKTLLQFEPGFLLSPTIVAWARETIRNLESTHAGRGIHYVQEEQPAAIAEAVVALRHRAVRVGPPVRG